MKIISANDARLAAQALLESDAGKRERAVEASVEFNLTAADEMIREQINQRRFRGSFTLMTEYPEVIGLVDVALCDAGYDVSVRELEPGTLAGRQDGWEYRTVHLSWGTAPDFVDED